MEKRKRKGSVREVSDPYSSLDNNYLYNHCRFTLNVSPGVFMRFPRRLESEVVFINIVDFESFPKELRKKQMVM